MSFNEKMDKMCFCCDWKLFDNKYDSVMTMVTQSFYSWALNYFTNHELATQLILYQYLTERFSEFSPVSVGTGDEDDPGTDFEDAVVATGTNL